MGANLSNCELTMIGDSCFSPVSKINSTLTEAAANNFVLNHENSKFKSENNEYQFSCIEHSVPYNGSLNCDINNYATIACGSKNITFSHREYCLFGFQFRKNETLIFDSRNLQSPLLAFPLPTNELTVSTQSYEGDLQEKWVLRSGYSGYVPNLGVASNTIISDQNISFDQSNINYISDEETEESKAYIIPVEQNKIESGGTLSFTIPIDKIKNNINMIISDENSKNIIGLELNNCCGKLADSNNGKYDRFSYPEKLTGISSLDLSLTWKSSIYTLNIKSTNTPIAAIPIENENVPYKAVLLDSKMREELKANWSYSTGVKSASPVSCTINGLEGKCKSSSVTVPKMVNPNLEFLRFGFLFSKEALSPFEMTISQNSNNLVTLQISSNIIKFQSDDQQEISLKKELSTGEWVSGDIFIVSDDIHNVIEEDVTITCKNYNDSCLNTQNNQNWMSIINEKSILRYAYLKKQAMENEAKTDADSESKSSLSSSKAVYYMYISLKNCIIAKLKINANSFNKVSVTNKQGSNSLVYWRLKSGISTSINILENTLNQLKTTISNEIEENER
ncbi:uncharacterized protein ELE39_003539 [Cryptosporidium sp. chipmunk genotype I]|uniref:uncharacterized protein n=1 Tax=Cryptosporidium sp. chipmunk genotype I TaxID=1280935 RepID=UPI00351A83AC|nr:hypothetical protein ELE39_003539 [Cryptosporidium sp. chipmunk genotype I]